MKNFAWNFHFDNKQLGAHLDSF